MYLPKFIKLMKYNIISVILSVILFACNNVDKVQTIGLQSNVDKNDDTIPQVQKVVYPDYLNIDYIMGKFDPETHDRFVRIENKYTNKTNVFLDKEAYNAFLRMYEDAYKSGFKLVIISATRNFSYQKRIWDLKWSKLSDSIPDQEKTLKILEYSSMPGSSRHHWGTEMDLNVLENSYFDEGEGRKIYDWLKKNAHNYGFCQPYSTGRDTGYNEERWHWSYLPLSSIYLKYARENMKDAYISGFKGAEFAQKIEVTRKYILGVSELCQ